MIGDIELLLNDALPPDVLRCDGSLVNKSDYPELFAVLGNTYGQATDDQFYLPTYETVDGAYDFYITAKNPILPTPGPDGNTFNIERTLDQAKTERYVAIDSRTDAIVDTGFEFPPGSGLRFSLSLAAQAKMLGLDLLKADPNLVYPISYNTLNDNAKFLITDATMAHNFFLTAVGTYRALIDSGTAIKDQVRAATSISDVDAIQDNR